MSFKGKLILFFLFLFCLVGICLFQIVVFLIIQIERVKGVQSSWMLFVFWCILALCGIVEFISKIYTALEQVRYTIHHTILFIILLTLIVKPRTFRKANLITKLAKILTERRH